MREQVAPSAPLTIMNLNDPVEILGKLQAVWYNLDSEDEHKKPVVYRYNVYDMVTIGLFAGGKIEEIFEYVANEGPSYAGMEDSFNGVTVEDMYEKADVASTRPGHITLDHFVNLWERDLKEDVFVRSAQAAAIAFNINIDDDTVNTAYWTQALEDGLSPIETVKGLLNP